MDLNRAQLIGNVTRDPDFRTTPTGQSVCSFGVATNAQWTDAAGQKQQRAEFHNCVAWGKLAEIIHQYVGKGKRLFVEGRMQTREWEAQDGAKRTRTEIVLDNMIMLDRAGTPGSVPSSVAPSEASKEPTIAPIDQTTTQPPKEDKGSGQEIRVEDIPF